MHLENKKMKKSEFKIGEDFYTETGKWRCTDVGGVRKMKLIFRCPNCRRGLWPRPKQIQDQDQDQEKSRLKAPPTKIYIEMHQ
jgi:hypothetical protein